ncbi:hypothetical protein ACJJBP_24605 [Pseudomonas aeruginosa]|uniref:hypothetical protein n=1 Tax=Pseudomonas aeruginosa TaxID=287 RepID=UPI00259E7DF5|nr:hypothetical protein [Pseudomonas aeruginosa]EKU6907691.1 hypothetical protein [Pseudomonas aeruginosa]EKU7015839.1 hypothetical protein [Pseudomonas aeruginosa]ELN8197440.1 hypothetical protein [Pseudomonas aeruginosa]MDQ2298221.1 hypothetical protein [Pseudomonas aeruginosa]MDQ2475284.1 hypothetical protein [Pseudomonas aeruginosa]
MSTFQEVNDASLIKLIGKAQQRVVFVAPGVHQAVAEALGKRLVEIDRLQLTVVIDPDEDVCRIGYGDAKGLELLSSYADRQSFALMAQPGLRVGVLLVDDVTLVWSPTPRSVEAAPLGNAASPTERSPNGLLLGANPGAQLAHAVSAVGTDTLPFDAEVGVEVVTKERVQKTLDGLAKNPPIPVDLARITRVYSTKLQFAEFTVKGAKFSKSQLKVSNDYMNADIQGELKGLVESRLRAFGDFRDEEVEVPAFNNGNEVFDSSQNRLKEKISEASLQRQRNELERRYLFNVPGFGRLIAKDDKQDLERLVAAYRVQLEAYSEAIRQRLDAQAGKIIDEAAKLIAERAARAGSKLDEKQLRDSIQKSLDRAKDEVPEVKLVFKDVTYEQTKNPEFRAKVDKALPAAKRKQMGDWNHDFDAAKSADGQVNVSHS